MSQPTAFTDLLQMFLLMVGVLLVLMAFIKMRPMTTLEKLGTRRTVSQEKDYRLFVEAFWREVFYATLYLTGFLILNNIYGFTT